ncbi:MAG: hypothetical protein SFV15_24930 [Polyangiaceae bacterium]|nr:hypothetical protein [Polyangiaceae bacterium]
MSHAPFAIAARLPPAYRQWNSLLADELFPRGRPGVPVYLAVHDGLLNESGARSGLGTRDDFVRAVLGLSTAPARLFVCLEREAEIWTENVRSGEPPIIAGLAFAVLAASEMATDGKTTQANYYFRLNALMGVENQGRPERFECTPDLWRKLRDWLRQERRGELIVHGLNSQHPYVDPVQSQCLVRSCDLEELVPVLREAHRSSRQVPEPDEVVPSLRAWLMRGGAQSRLARLLGRDPDEASLLQAAEALCNGIEGSGFSQMVGLEEARGFKVERATLAVRPSKYPNLTWTRAKWLLRIPTSDEAEEAECLATVGNQTALGKLDIREPPCYDIEISGADAARLLCGQLTVTDDSGNDITPSPATLSWFQDGALGGRPGSWRLVPAPSAGTEHTLVSTSADNAAQVVAALERPSMQLVGELWPGPGLHAVYAAVPCAGAILPGNVLVRGRPLSLRLNGGLRIRRGIYLRGGLPQPEAPEGAVVRVQRDGEPEPVVVVQAAALASVDLPEGQYSLECEGATAELFVLEPRWRECIASLSQPTLDRSMRNALSHGQMRGATFDVERPRHAAYFQPGTRYRLYAPAIIKGVAPPNAGIHEYLSSDLIRHVTVTGRSAGAGPLTSAACFGEISGARSEGSGQDRNDMNRLLEYMSARSTGSVDAVRTYCAGIAGDGAWHRPLSVLDALGHVDVSWDEGPRWAVAPPAAVSSADRTNLSILTGARSLKTIEWLGRNGIEAFVDPRSTDPNREPMPECILASTDSLLRAADVLREIRLNVVPESPSQQLALQTRSIAELSWWTGAAFSPPVARIQQTLQQWNSRELRWLASADVTHRGLYRWRENGRRVHYLVVGSTGVSVLDPAAAKWLLAPGDAGYLRYDLNAHRLLVPTAMDLPRIWKRICTVASGLAPLRVGRVLVYEDIPLDLARAAAVRLNQPRTEGIL